MGLVWNQTGGGHWRRAVHPRELLCAAGAKQMSHSTEDRELRLATVLDQLLEDSREGNAQQKLEETARSHPDLADDLRGLFATARMANDLGILNELDDLSQIPPSDSSNPSSKPRRRPSLSIPGYELQEEIGRGGMGVVYRAWQTSLRRQVALKMILNAEFASDRNLGRFRSEALATARLRHPGIVPVYEVGEHEGQPWFSMQYIEGTTLSARLQQGPMAPRQAVKLMVSVVDAIGSAHREGILHRDLKPGNILITSDGNAYVTDFGLAKQVRASGDREADPVSEMHSLTQSGAILGTPSWMSPEQAGGQPDSVDITSDIYSLGAVLFAMLTGRPPFQAASPVDTVLLVLEQDPPNIRMLNRSVDADLEMIVMKCLQKPQDLRYSSTKALADDLRAWLQNEPVSARSSTIAQILTRVFRESHHAAILQSWGLLWMLHSLVVLLLCLLTNAMQLSGVDERWPFVGLWVIGLGLWAAVFWNLRHRSGPITAVERQIAHIWAGSMIASSMLFAVESIMGRPVLEFSPCLGVITGMVFLAKAGILSGRFYIEAAMLFLTSLVMAFIESADIPDFSVSLFGLVSAMTFFLPGLKYYRQQQKSLAAAASRK